MAQIVKLRRSSVSGQKPTNSNLQLGELALNTTDGKVYMAKSGSLGPSVEELISTNTVNTGSLHLVGSITASAFSGSASGLINVPFQISGSDLSGNTYNKQFTKLQFDDSTGLNVEETNPGTAFISIGSHFKDIFVSGSPLLSATGSDAFEVIGSGGIGITTSITDTNGNGYIKELNINSIPSKLFTFADQCKAQGMENNKSIDAMKIGRWGNEAWWYTYTDDKIVSIRGCHSYDAYEKDCWRLMVRTATLKEYRARAPGDFRVMKNDFNWGFILPYQIAHARKHGAKKLIFTTNVSGDSGSVRMNDFVAKILAPAGLCKLIEANANIFYTTQNVWEILT